MASFEIIEYIERSPEEVFDFMTDPEQAHKIRPAIRKVKALEDGPEGQARYEVTRQQGGHEVPSETRVQAAQRPWRYTLESEREGLKLVYDYQLQAEAKGTRVTLKADVQAEGLRRVLAWLVARVLYSQDADLLRALELAMAMGEEAEI